MSKNEEIKADLRCFRGLMDRLKSEELKKALAPLGRLIFAVFKQMNNIMLARETFVSGWKELGLNNNKALFVHIHNQIADQQPELLELVHRYSSAIARILEHK